MASEIPDVVNADTAASAAKPSRPAAPSQYRVTRSSCRTTDAKDGPGKAVDALSAPETTTTMGTASKRIPARRDPQPPRQARLAAAESTAPPKVRKRTSQEVQALAAKKAALEQEEQEFLAKRRRQLAELDAEMQEADQDMEKNRILRKNDLDIEGEAVDVDISVDGAFVERDDEMDVDDVPKQSGRKGKPARGVIRAQQHAEADRILAERGIVVSQRTAATVPAAKSKRSQPTTEKGLIRSWEARVTRIKPGREDLPQEAEDAMGGLNDEDVIATAPQVTGRLSTTDRNAALVRAEAGLRTDLRRNNEVVELSSDDEVQTKARKKPARTKTGRTAVKHEKDEPSLALASAQVSTSSSPIIVSTPSQLPLEESAVIDALLDGVWTASFLPAIYCRMFASDAPFGWIKGPGFPALLQDVLARRFPEWANLYTIKDRSRTYLKASSRVNEKRSEIARDAVNVVERFYNQPSYRLNEPKIRSHATWAICPNGPAVWKTPTPKALCDMGMESDDEEYVRPDGIFESDTVIEVLAPHLKLYAETDIGCGRPVGLLALVAAAVERAYSQYVGFINGNRSEVNTFSKDKYGPALLDYVANAKKLSSRRWASIYALCNVEETKKRKLPGADGAMARKRHRLYVPSSPPPEDA